MYKIQTEVKFDAAHKLPNYNGKCGNLHGHTWKVVIILEATQLDKNGFVVDFTKIKKVVNKFDHKYLNDYIENPTAENLAIYFAMEIKKEANSVKFVTVKVYESDVSFAEVTI